MNSLARALPINPALIRIFFVAAIACGLFSFAIPRAQAADLTQSQIQAVDQLLVAFDVDAETVAAVDVALHTPEGLPAQAGEVLGASTSASCVTLARLLSFGSRGSDVAQFQNLLTAQGFLSNGSATGYFGSATQAALQQWQSSHGIVSSGSPSTTGYGATGPKTRAALACISSGSTSSTAASPATTNGPSMTIDSTQYTIAPNTAFQVSGTVTNLGGTLSLYITNVSGGQVYYAAGPLSGASYTVPWIFNVPGLSAGTYHISVVDSLDSIYQVSAALTVTDTPPITFTASPTSGAIPLTVTLSADLRGIKTGSSAGDIQIVYFGEPTQTVCKPISSGVAACPQQWTGTHTYTVAGSHTAQLIQCPDNSASKGCEGGFTILGTVVVTATSAGQPQITAIEPSHGTEGTLVTILGGAFSAKGNPTVNFLQNGKIMCTLSGGSFSHLDSTTIQFTISGVFAANCTSGAYQVRYSNGSTGAVSNAVNFVLTAVDRGATFDATPTSGQAPLSVWFYMSGLNQGLSQGPYAVDFGDKSGVYATNTVGKDGTTHVYTAAGTYTAKLYRINTGLICIATNLDCNKIVIGTVAITVTAPPPAITITKVSLPSVYLDYKNLPAQTTSVFVNKDTGAQFNSLAVQFYDGGSGQKTVTIDSWLNMPSGNYFLRAYDWNWQHVITESNTVYFGGKDVSLTAIFTINGATNTTLKVGDTVNYAWSSTGGASAKATYTQDSSSCGVTGTGPFGFFGPKSAGALGGTDSEPVTDCWAGHTYTITYTVTDSQGRTASASATVKALSATTTSAAFGQQRVATSASPDVAGMLGAVAAAPFNILIDSLTEIFVAFGVGQ